VELLPSERACISISITPHDVVTSCAAAFQIQQAQFEKLTAIADLDPGV
jgi:hypothetical protein